jgi:prepilin signal peptidase PulO-like enzyme (type II secretory pathway)
VHVVLVAGDRSWRQEAVPPWRRPFPLGPFLSVGAIEYLTFAALVDPWFDELRRTAALLV